ncbi:phage integrase central domain-containing protein [Pandoraea horticolens]|uniref:phage integrase central domain-containing protein n=1 Tax=Pandoraea horticolens TaxID=2508298 RepID=UPI003CCCEBFA
MQEVKDGDGVAPLWHAKTETASRVRGRIESVLDWASFRGYREGENPARWTGHLEHELPARSKIQKVKHHAALPYRQVASFMKELRSRDGVSARALEFSIFTAARSGEVRGGPRRSAERRGTRSTFRLACGQSQRIG